MKQIPVSGRKSESISGDVFVLEIFNCRKLRPLVLHVLADGWSVGNSVVWGVGWSVGWSGCSGVGCGVSN